MSDYQYDPDSKTYRLEPDTQDFSLADVPDLGEANVEGNAKDNVITGNDADNILNGMLGADTLIGGLGNDQYYVDSSDDVVTEDINGGSLDLIFTTASYVLPDHVETLVLQGYDSIEGTGNNDANDMIGNGESNILRGAGGDDRLFGADGNDTLAGGAGADRLWGGSGDDTFLVDEDDEIIEDEGAGNDWVVASFSYTLGDHLENLRLSGSQALSGNGNGLDNQIIGADGNDTLEGGLGNDSLSGGAGDDVLNGGDGSDTVVFAGARANYIVTKNADGSFTVVDTRLGGDGEDALVGIEFIQFADSSLDLVAAANPPSDLKLDGSADDVSVVEGATGIGALTADQSGITWSFDTTAEGGGDADGMFVIDENGQVTVAPGKVLEYDGSGAVHTYTIVVKATNAFGVTSTHSFTIIVANNPSDDNHAPTGVSLSGGTIAEDASVGAAIATLTGQDPDTGDSFTYTLVDENGQDLVDSFFAIGTGANFNKILIKAGLNDAQVGTHDLWIKVTDAGGLSTIRKVTLTVTNVNEDPTDVRLDGYSGSVMEGATIIGTLQADDEDGDSIGWSFDTTAEGGGNAGGMFAIDENGRVTVAPNNVLEYDGAQAVRTYTIHVVASDGHGSETRKFFTIDVTNDTSDDNRAPTSPMLSIHINESATSVTIGTLSATDLDGDTLTYVLVDGNGNDVSVTSDFAIRPVMSGAAVSRYELVTKGGVQVTADQTREIWVKVDDGKGGTATQKFLVTIKDVPAPVNHAPTDISLSNTSVQEGAARGTLVGLLSATDPNAGDSFTYSLTDERFEISADGRLLVKDGAKIDYETAQVHQIRVTVADKAGATYDEVFTIQVGDAVETQTGTQRNDALTGGIGNDRLLGSAGSDRLSGAGGNDMLYGSTGNDVLTGGTGSDIFVFDTKLNKSTNVDRVMDFRTQDDSVWLDNKVFTKLGTGSASKPKKFKSDMFVEGKKAKDAEDRIVYDKKTGTLYYDADGTGSKAQVKIAIISNKTKLYYHDFFVI